MRRLLLIAAAALGLTAQAGCGGSLSPASEPVARQVRQVFTAYTRAMGRGDYEAACSHLAPESIQRMRRGAGQFVPNPPRACPDVLRVVLDRSTPKARRELREIARSARVVRVLLGDQGPSIRWTARVNGKRVSVAQDVRRINGEYKLVSVRRG